MNTPIWPPLLDETYLWLTGILAVAALVFSTLTSENHTRSILGSVVDRYRAIPDEELGPALEDAGKTRFYSLLGIVAVLVCATVWRLILYYGVVLGRLGKANGWPTWFTFLLSVLPAVVMPLLFQAASRWLIRKRLDRKFAERLAT